MMLQKFHSPDKSLSAKLLFKNDNSTATSIQILNNATLKEHLTKIPALLVCISGKVIYKDENNKEIVLESGGFYEIEPMILHWVEAIEDSQLLLVR